MELRNAGLIRCIYWIIVEARGGGKMTIDWLTLHAVVNALFTDWVILTNTATCCLRSKFVKCIKLKIVAPCHCCSKGYFTQHSTNLDMASVMYML